MKNGDKSNAQECPAFNQLIETTDLILADLERDSQFFDENLLMLLPEFDPPGEFQVSNSVLFLSAYTIRLPT
jgi:hypothetical protein